MGGWGRVKPLYCTFQFATAKNRRFYNTARECRSLSRGESRCFATEHNIRCSWLRGIGAHPARMKTRAFNIYFARNKFAAAARFRSLRFRKCPRTRACREGRKIRRETGGGDPKVIGFLSSPLAPGEPSRVIRGQRARDFCSAAGGVSARSRFAGRAGPCVFLSGCTREADNGPAAVAARRGGAQHAARARGQGKTNRDVRRGKRGRERESPGWLRPPCNSALRNSIARRLAPLISRGTISFVCVFVFSLLSFLPFHFPLFLFLFHRRSSRTNDTRRCAGPIEVYTSDNLFRCISALHAPLGAIGDAIDDVEEERKGKGRKARGGQCEQIDFHDYLDV